MSKYYHHIARVEGSFQGVFEARRRGVFSTRKKINQNNQQLGAGSLLNTQQRQSRTCHSGY